MDDKSQAELNILIAADRWARDIMRHDKFLDSVEQTLLDAVLHYQRLTRTVVEIPPVQLPRPPNVPKDLYNSIEEIKTARYSDIPTAPSPAHGIPAYNDDIEFEEELWTIGKPKPE